jgi:hypothetical protein
VEIKWSDLVVKDARKLKSFIQYIKQNKILNNTVTTKTISQERIINDTVSTSDPIASSPSSIVPNKAARIDGLVKYTLNLVACLNVFALTSTR